MNISCSICAELYRSSDASNLRVTRCGHVFHNLCLSKWLENGKSTCPECRSKTTSSTVMRLYVNIADNSYVDSSQAPDLTSLISEIDNLNLQLRQKSDIVKQKDKDIKLLNEEKRKLSNGQKQSKTIILTLEQRIDQNNLIEKNLIDQIKLLKLRISDLDKIEGRLDEANKKLRTMDVMQQIISGTQKETEELLREGRTATELTTLVTALKRELRNDKEKLSKTRTTLEELTNELRTCKDEKSKLEDKCLILESKIFQMENNTSKDIFTDSRENSIEESNTEISPPYSKPIDSIVKRFSKRVTKLEPSKSPSLNIKSSSIGGLTPILKRSASSEPYKLPLGDHSKNDGFSILKKRRLISSNNTTKKSDLRPSRPTTQTNHPTSTTTVSSFLTNLDQPTGFSFQSFERNKTANLNNKFRFGSVSNPNH